MLQKWTTFHHIPSSELVGAASIREQTNKRQLCTAMKSASRKSSNRYVGHAGAEESELPAAKKH